MRDRADNCVIICSIENVDPMGVHTGDSITVAPAQTLSDVEYQQMRNAAFACIRRVGVETGRVERAVRPRSGHRPPGDHRDEPAGVAVVGAGVEGDRVPDRQDRHQARRRLHARRDPERHHQATPACFEPSIDYVVTKVPRWAFEKLPGTTGVLGTQMQSVGEVMAIGRTFPESLQKALRSLEQGRLGLNADPAEQQLAGQPTAGLLAASARRRRSASSRSPSCSAGVTVDQVHAACRIDEWFLDQIARSSRSGRCSTRSAASDGRWTAGRGAAKQLGFSDAQLAHLWRTAIGAVRSARQDAGVVPTYKTVDTCAAEFAASTPYHYSTWEDEDEVRPSDRPRVVILGSGPNRIGQGIEFDYCCVHASFALREAGFETVMVNCNPETVSTDYDTSDRLYFEPLTAEDVHNVIAAETAAAGGVAPKVIVALGGQTPLKLAAEIPAELVAGTTAESIDAAEDREKWNRLCHDLGIPQPPGGTAIDLDQARAVARDVGYPGARAPELRPRRPGDAHRPRRGPAARGDGRARRPRQPRS